jgi:phosphatidylserine decarboxylase
MNLPASVKWFLQQEDVNFVVTNRIPRRLATRLVGWISRIENPIVSRLSIAVFALFAGDLRLHEAKKTRFGSLHDCFVRELKDGARPIASDASVLVSPCDGCVGAVGAIDDVELLQAKGLTYTLDELLGDSALVERYRRGSYVTLRLSPNMYHRFHAPWNCRIAGATYISGDTWNVNPPAVKRIERLYCKNERVVIDTSSDGVSSERIALVAVGAILVASVHLSFVKEPLRLSEGIRHEIACDATCRKGEELGYFHYGSTIIVLATEGFIVCDHVRSGEIIRMGEPLLCRSTSSGRR